MSFAPGKLFQFDWSHETITLQGLPLMIKAAHIEAVAQPHAVRSRLLPRDPGTGWPFDAHDKAFQFYGGGLPTRHLRQHEDGGGSDLRRQGAPVQPAAFCRMCSHHLIEPVACTPAAGWEKGQVENQVGNLRDRFFLPKPRTWKSLTELNAWLRKIGASLMQSAPNTLRFKDRTHLGSVPG